MSDDVTRCCHCKKIVREPKFCVPEDFPRDPRHGGLPLCDACGGGPLPTLDEICLKLDADRLRRWRRMIVIVFATIVAVSFVGGVVFGRWGIVVGTVYSTVLTRALLRERPTARGSTT